MRAEPIQEVVGEPTHAFVETFRYLLLPVQSKNESGAIEAAWRSVLGHIDEETAPDWLRLEALHWKSSTSPSASFRNVVGAALSSGDDQLSDLIAGSYFEMHRRLLVPALGLSFEGATALLSYARLIHYLAAEELMSATQIANQLSQREGLYRFTWKAVGTVLARLRASRSVTATDLQEQWNRDAARELSEFSDASREDALDLMEEVAGRLGYPDAIRSQLEQLYPAPGEFFAPFLQILHFQSAVLEFYDHSATWVYEFSPRGQLGVAIFERYPEHMNVRGNPMLNNAKAVQRLDELWVLGRDANVIMAASLSGILTAVQSMPYSAAREFAAWIRIWLLRVMRLESDGDLGLVSVSLEEAEVLIDRVVAEPTHTSGVLEQRLLDACIVVKYASDEWVVRGIGDSVNATNLSRRKLGDCDAQNSDQRRVTAFESHGGRLSDVYIELHKQTLRRVLPFRKLEWGDDTWEVDLVFVSYEKTDTDLHPMEVIDGIPVNISQITFEELVQSIEDYPALVAAASDLISSHLSLPSTPREIRDTTLGYLR